MDKAEREATIASLRDKATEGRAAERALAQLQEGDPDYLREQIAEAEAKGYHGRATNLKVRLSYAVEGKRPPAGLV